MPPGGRGNLRIVPSVSLHAVKGSEWIIIIIIIHFNVNFISLR